MKKQQIEENLIIPELTDDEIREFEQELENYKLSAKMFNELSYYGQPLKNQDRFLGYVNNSILGGVHWSVIDYCLKNSILRKNRFSNWFSVAEVYERMPGGRCETNAYDRFIKKWRGLKDLRERRLYASDMEKERFGGGRLDRVRKILDIGRQELYKKMSWGI